MREPRRGYVCANKKIKTRFRHKKITHVLGSVSSTVLVTSMVSWNMLWNTSSSPPPRVLELELHRRGLVAGLLLLLLPGALSALDCRGAGGVVNADKALLLYLRRHWHSFARKWVEPDVEMATSQFRHDLADAALVRVALLNNLHAVG